jgi:CheY-like chemotaxis protein
MKAKTPDKREDIRGFQRGTAAIVGTIVIGSLTQYFTPHRLLFMTSLVDAGVAETMHATNGREALAFLTSEVVDLIISDWSMPEMDGLELLKVCKAEQIVRRRTAQ